MIEVKHLTKRYGDHIAVSDLSFTIEKGQIYGFLGPNGAGYKYKYTVKKINVINLLCVIVPSYFDLIDK